MLLQFLDEIVTRLVLPFLTKDDGCLNHHTTDIVGYTGDGTLYHGRMRHQGTLYFERTNTVAGTLDHIVDTTLKPVIAVFIAPGHIACVVETVVPSLMGQLRIAVVFLEQANGFAVADTYHDFTLLTILA